MDNESEDVVQYNEKTAPLADSCFYCVIDTI